LHRYGADLQESIEPECNCDRNARPPNELLTAPLSIDVENSAIP